MTLKKSLLVVFCIYAVLCGLVLVVEVHSVKAASKTITVLVDYPTIQEAINHAEAGDTVFVKSGTYLNTPSEGILINKSISLIGENSQNTIITRHPVEYTRYAHITVNIKADNVTVSGFTITGSSIGVLVNGSNCKITGNNISNNIVDGVDTSSFSKNISIIGNNITGNLLGIYHQSSGSIISKNIITQNKHGGIIVDSCENVTVVQNKIAVNGAGYGGLMLRNNGQIFVFENDITDNIGYGIEFAEDCNNATIHNNNIMRNSIGISLFNYDIIDQTNIGVGNTVYYNNIIENTQNAHIETAYRYGNITHIDNGTDVVLWDNGYFGNHWSDYKSKYPDATEIDNSGIWNIPYLIDSNNIDHYPLTRQIDTAMLAPTPSPAPSPTVPEFSAWMILAFTLIAMSIITYYYKKRQPKLPLAFHVLWHNFDALPDLFSEPI